MLSSKQGSIGIPTVLSPLHHLALASAIQVRNHLNVQTPAKIAVALVEFILVTS